MLLSTVVSFLLANRFHQKTYVFLSAVTLLSVSFLSTGMPFRESAVSSAVSMPLQHSSGIVIRYPLPLSFPFYSVVSHTSEQREFPYPTQLITELYQIEFVTLQFPQAAIQTIVYRKLTSTNPPIATFNLDWGDYLLYYTFFFSLNLVGAIAGYWISKSTLAKLIEGGAKSIIKRVDVALRRVSLGYLAAFYIFLTAVDILQTFFVFPEYEIGIIASVFIGLFSNQAWLYFPFRIILTLMIVILVYRYTPLHVSKKLFVILSLITLASVVWNTYCITLRSS